MFVLTFATAISISHCIHPASVLKYKYLRRLVANTGTTFMVRHQTWLWPWTCALNGVFDR